MINSILRNIKIKDIDLYKYNEKEINKMLINIYRNNLDIDEKDIINFFNNNLCDQERMLNNKYIFTNIFYLYLLSNINNYGLQSRVRDSINLFKKEFKIDINFFLEICPPNSDYINTIPNNGLVNNDYMEKLEMNFEIIYNHSILPKQRMFSKEIVENYFNFINECKEYIEKKFINNSL